jgi:hypothetical protein
MRPALWHQIWPGLNESEWENIPNGSIDVDHCEFDEIEGKKKNLPR